MAEDRGQRTEGRGQKAEDRRQKADVKGQRPRQRQRSWDQERFGVLDHAAEHASYLAIHLSELRMPFRRDVTTVPGEVERRIRLTVLAITS